MAKRRRSGGSSSIVARAEGWYGVSHNVPRRGTAAHRAMVSKYMRAHPGVRHNPSKSVRDLIRAKRDEARMLAKPKKAKTAAEAKKLGIPVRSTLVGHSKDGRALYNYSGSRHDTVMFGAVRRNPITTQRERRVLHPENCSAETTQRLLAKRKAEGRAGVKHKTSRIGNCDYRSASYALAHHTGGGGGSLASRILPWWPSSK